eukprot:gene24615-22_t
MTPAVARPITKISKDIKANLKDDIKAVKRLKIPIEDSLVITHLVGKRLVSRLCNIQTIDCANTIKKDKKSKKAKDDKQDNRKSSSDTAETDQSLTIGITMVQAFDAVTWSWWPRPTKKEKKQTPKSTPKVTLKVKQPTAKVNKPSTKNTAKPDTNGEDRVQKPLSKKEQTAKVRNVHLRRPTYSRGSARTHAISLDT